MYYWTFQHKSVRETIEKNGYYLPDFSYVFGSYFMEDPYRLALCAFKRNNPSFRVLRGLVFAFERDLNKPFETVEEIQEFFDENPGDFLFIKKRTDEYDINDYELLQLSGFSDIKTVPVDITFFTSLDDCEFDFSENNGVELVNIMNSYGKTPSQICEMFDSWLNGVYSGPYTKSSHLLQHHLPYIQKENIVNVYPANKVITFLK